MISFLYPCLLSMLACGTKLIDTISMKWTQNARMELISLVLMVRWMSPVKVSINGPAITFIRELANLDQHLNRHHFLSITSIQVSMNFHALNGLINFLRLASTVKYEIIQTDYEQYSLIYSCDYVPIIGIRFEHIWFLS